jgi:hypothetical protein
MVDECLNKKVVKRIFKYLNDTLDLNLWYSRGENFTPTTYIQMMIGKTMLMIGKAQAQGDNPLISKGESRRQEDNYLYALWTMCYVAGFSSMTKGEIVGIIVIDVKGLILSLMSYYDITIYT